MNNLDEIKRIDKDSFFNYMKKTFFKFKELMNVEELYYYTDTPFGRICNRTVLNPRICNPLQQFK